MKVPKIDGLFHGKSIYKWMMTGGTPVSGNLQMVKRKKHGADLELW